MRFWEPSALIPLVVAERSTTRVKRWLREDPDVIVWTLTRVELLSALARRRREEPESAPQLLAARRDLLGTWERWSEVTAMELVAVMRKGWSRSIRYGQQTLYRLRPPSLQQRGIQRLLNLSASTGIWRRPRSARDLES